MTVKHASLRSLLDELHSDRVIALTRMGVKKKMLEVAHEMAPLKRPVMLVGAFSEGHFSSRTLESVNVKYSIDSRSLEASTVVARAIYDFEVAIGLERFPNPRN
jgi:rRNA pseudouridine-1189 N-methylase Emg1 (Nep1/Mra1 family)